MPTEALNPGHGAAQALDPFGPCPSALPGEHRPEEDAEHPAEQRGVACQEEADLPWQAQDPLPIWGFRQHPVDQVRRRVVHPTGRARWTESPILAREGSA